MPRLISLASLQYKRLYHHLIKQETISSTSIPHYNMKVLAALLCASTALEACTVSAQALLYTSEPGPPPSKQGPPPISPITARLLLAQRLGLSQYHSLEDANEATLEILNTYGGEQPRIFDDEDQTWGDDKFLLIIEGVSEPEGRHDSGSL